MYNELVGRIGRPVESGVVVMDVTGRIIDFEMGELDEEQVLELFQELVNSGLAWQLQGSYGRMAQALISEGLISG